MKFIFFILTVCLANTLAANTEVKRQPSNTQPYTIVDRFDGMSKVSFADAYNKAAQKCVKYFEDNKGKNGWMDASNIYRLPESNDPNATYHVQLVCGAFQ